MMTYYMLLQRFGEAQPDKIISGWSRDCSRYVHINPENIRRVTRNVASRFVCRSTDDGIRELWVRERGQLRK